MSTGGAGNLELVEAARGDQLVMEKDLELTKHALDSTEESSMDDTHISSEDLARLRRVSGKIPWTAYTIAFVELCERFSYYGTTTVYVRSLMDM